jgi:tetratricopeptide (TPR) repeat protein/transglutaminase-like putative cysteine protease
MIENCGGIVVRGINVLLGGAAIFVASSASAADTLKFGPPPAWVTPQPIPQAKPTDAPVNVLLSNAQITMEPGKIATYGEIVFKIQNPQGLAAGNLSLSWQPATDTVIVNKLQIRRGDKIIDVLASGQTFTVLRRETNLEAAMFDGTLTANIQPEGLQEGDIVEFASTTEHSDPVLKGHVEALFGSWNESPIESAYTKLTWPAELKLNVRKSSSLPEPKKSSRDGKSVFELSALHIEPISPPKGAPSRFKVGRLVEATDYSSWADLADLMAPLFRAAAVIPAAGPLHDEVEQIRTSSSDPKRRAELALALAQDRVRYVALLMGQGGYVPATAETTWSRRFGDCKAKTALLVAILHALQIEAEPVLVQSTIGDMIGDRLPALELFDHVLVRAHIAGKDYWLDGTRTGDITLDGIQVPDFGWGLPLVSNARLVQIVPPALTAPNVEHRVEIDASSGVLSAIPITIEEIYRGDSAVAFNTLYSRFTAAQRDEFAHDIAKKYYDGFATASTSFQFDKAKRAFDVTIKGTAKLNWDDGWLSVPTSSIAFDPDFDRPSGPGHDAPFAVSHPRFVNDRATILLPVDFAAQQKLSPRIQETLAGVEYARTESIDGNKLTVTSSERSVVAEVPYKDALAAEPRLRALNKDDIYLRMANNYKPSDKELASLAESALTSASDYLNRGNLYLDRWKMDEAISDFSKAIDLDPKNEWALADRGLAYIWKEDLVAAEKDLAAAEAIDSDNPIVARARGLLAEHQGNYKAAVAAYTKALQKDSANGFALGHRALVRHSDGDDDGALADSDAALAKDPAWMDLRVLRANIFYQRGDRPAVTREAELVTQQNPKSIYAFVAAGKFYARLGANAEAMKSFDRALAIGPAALTYINRSQARPSTETAARIADLDVALKLEPDNSDALAEKARLLSQAGDYKRALELLDRIKPDPTNDYAEVQRAIVLFKAGRKAEAERIFVARRKNAKSASELNSLCWDKATNAIDLESALQDCRDALKLKPDSSQYLDSLGMVLLKLGKLDEALTAYNQAIAKNTSPASLMGRAFVYDRQGKRAEATADAAAARRIFPDIDSMFAEYGLTFTSAPPARSATAR